MRWVSLRSTHPTCYYYVLLPGRATGASQRKRRHTNDMKDYMVPLNSIASLVPKTEFDDAWQLVSALIGLEQFTQAFRIAIELFDFSAFQLQQARDERDTARAASGFYNYGLWREKSQRFVGWQHIAARDGALQIYHMGIVMEKIRNCSPPGQPVS